MAFLPVRPQPGRALPWTRVLIAVGPEHAQDERIIRISQVSTWLNMSYVSARVVISRRNSTVLVETVSELDRETEQRPLQRGVEQKVILVVVHIEIAVAEDQGVALADIQARVSDDLIGEV